MDRISLLSDDVILKILSFVPTKVAIATDRLSKRWRYLWKHVPKLVYFDLSPDTEHWRTSRFVDKFLLLHKAPVLETMSLILSRNCPPIDIETWISVASSRGMRYLSIHRFTHAPGPILFPRSLYTCETLVSLYLEADLFVNDVPLVICFRSLKVLSLIWVKFSSDEMVDRILSGCPILQKLMVVRRNDDNVKTFKIAVPSLRRLIAIDCYNRIPRNGFVIKAPSLKSLCIYSSFSEFCSLVKMLDVVKADIKLRQPIDKFLECVTSTKQLSLCLYLLLDSRPMAIGVFKQLVSLNLCTCSLFWCPLILNRSPKLRVLSFQQKRADHIISRILNQVPRCCSSSACVDAPYWQPSSVPECLISSLETVEWIDYKGTQSEKIVVMYLLENSRQLKTMAIRSLESTNDREKLKMLQELSSIQRISTKCRLSFT